MGLMRHMEPMNKTNLADKFSLIKDHWNPRIAGELNGQLIKLVKFQGPFTWHHHETEDEMFLVVKGRFRMDFREDGEERGGYPGHVAETSVYTKASKHPLITGSIIAGLGLATLVAWRSVSANHSELGRSKVLLDRLR